MMSDFLHYLLGAVAMVGGLLFLCFGTAILFMLSLGSLACGNPGVSIALWTTTAVFFFGGTFLYIRMVAWMTG